MDAGQIKKLDINEVLTQEMELTKGMPWSRLPKIERVNKLDDFCRRYGESEKLDSSKIAVLSRYLRTALDQRRIHRAKDVVYDKDTGQITSIPALKYHSKTGRFTLKREEPEKRTQRKKNSPRGSLATT